MEFMEYRVLALVLGCSLVALALLGVFTLIGIKMLRSGSKRRRAELDQEEKLIQEIYQGLLKMEQRVDALETILLDRPQRRARDEL